MEHRPEAGRVGTAAWSWLRSLSARIAFGFCARPGGPHPGVRRAARVSSILAAGVVAVMPGVAAGQQRPAALPPSAYLEDFDSAWTFIGDTYAYLEEKAVDWRQVRDRLRPRAAAIRDNDEFIGLLEELVEHLYDHHAHLGVNTASSPRLVPSGADLWAVHRSGTALITQVRAGSDGERVGLRSGMEVVSVDGLPVADAVEDRLPGAVDRTDPEARDWALRVLLAGRHDGPVRLEVRDRGRLRSFEYRSGRSSRPDSPLEAGLLDHRIGYVRLHDSLGQAVLVPAWDAALDMLRETDGLILDLRDTPGGGNSTVARGLLGRLVSEIRPYQRHDLPREERLYGIRRIWVEHVAPRGPYAYDKPIAVLVGRWTASMGEGVAIGLDGARRGTVFGSAMAGLRGAVYARSLAHTGIPVRVPAERLHHVDGAPREAFVPRLPRESTSSGGDAVLERALEWMRGGP